MGEKKDGRCEKRERQGMGEGRGEKVKRVRERGKKDVKVKERRGVVKKNKEKGGEKDKRYKKTGIPNSGFFIELNRGLIISDT